MSQIGKSAENHSSDSEEIQIQIRPQDSVSNTGSKCSSVSSIMLKALAKKAELRAEASNLKRKQKLRVQEQELRDQIEQLELQTELDKVTAVEEVCAQFEDDQQSTTSMKTRQKQFTVADIQVHGEFSGLEPEFIPDQKIKPVVKKEQAVISDLSNNPENLIHLNTIKDEKPIKPEEEAVKQNDVTLLADGIVRGIKSMNSHTKKIECFNGDPLNYNHFIRSFNKVINSKDLDYEDKLDLLRQNTTGEAKDLVKGCEYNKSPQLGFEKAMNLLKVNYGKPFVVKQAHLKIITERGQIKSDDIRDLKKLSVELLSFKNTMEDLNEIRKLDNSEDLDKITEKLPTFMQTQFRKIADEVMFVKDMPLTLEDLCLFVEKQIRVMNNPLIGVHRQKQNSTVRTHESQPARRQRRTFAATSSSETSRQSTSNGSGVFTKNMCKCCKVNVHYLNHCEMFKRLDYNGRVKFVADNKLCFSCLNSGHMSDKCFRTKPCVYCTGKHQSLLHPPNAPPAPQITNSPQSRNSVETQTQTVLQGTNNNNSQVLLPIVAIKIKTSDDKLVPVYCLLDSGSDTSYCSEKLYDELGLIGRPVTFTRSTMSNANECVTTKVVNNVKFTDWYESNETIIPSLFTQPSININKDVIPKQWHVNQFKYLSSIELPEIDKDVDLILGNDLSAALEPFEIIPSENNGPFALRTKAGWLINGCACIEKFKYHCHSTVLFASVTKQQPLCSLCFDYVDCLQNGKLEPSVNHKRFLDIAKCSIKLNDENHYEIDLPFKYDNVQMPDNKAQSLQRVFSLKKRFIKNPDFFDKYKATMDMLFDNKYAVYADEKPEVPGKQWYLQHHGVFHPKKPDKLRVVFNCSAEYKGHSLNKMLLGGPDLNNNLVGVLLRFRQGLVAFQADIKTMFYQVKVPDAQTNFLKFLWWHNNDLSQPPQTCEMKTHIFGAISSPAMANYALRQVARDNKLNFSAETISTVESNYYVDDVLKSQDDVATIKQLIGEMITLLKKGGFVLSKFVSNFPEVLSDVPESDCELVELKPFPNDEYEHPALGVQWNVNRDTLGYNNNVSTKANTRRGFLSVVNSIFDPLGLVCPLITTGRMILQELHACNLDWDDNCPNDTLKRWEKWIGDLNYLNDLKINRCIKPPWFGKITHAEIHNFADASKQAMCAVSYLKIFNHDNISHTTIMLAKSRLVPLKSKLTIPRLELSASVLALKLDNMLRTELQIPINESHFWTDSSTVLHFIRNENKTFPTFVANRINKIRDSSDLNNWHYVNTKENVADMATRPVGGSTFVNYNEWINGPSFLNKSQEFWPEPPITLSNLDESNCQNYVTVKSSVEKNSIIKLLGKHSSWNKLRKVVALILRYKNVLRNRAIKRKDGDLPELGSAHMRVFLSADEIKNAERSIVSLMQGDIFSEEIGMLRLNKPIKRSSRLVKLNPFLKNGILRVGGRLDKSNLSFEQKHPQILTREMCITPLIINHFHALSGHSGRSYVLSSIRKNYWIVNGNATVRSVLGNCVKCKRIRGKLSTQFMSELPPERLECDSAPFTNTGLDYFGPFLIKKGRTTFKRYGVIFTCMVSRAVHLEVSSDLTTDSFIMALRRFIARRGNVTKRFRSDNGSNLVGAVNELKQCIKNWNKSQINNFLVQREIDWVFNPPSASHYGGAWERLIRSVRQILNATVSDQILTDESLITLMCEAEAILNGRPLTVVNSEASEPLALTPNDLLMQNSVSLPPGEFDSKDLYSKKRWRQVQQLANVFWNRFKNEYMSLLQTRQKWFHIKDNLKINDIVLINNSNITRNNWPMGRVIKLYPDKDNVVRKVDVKTKDGVLLRPIAKLCLIFSDKENL